jgi:CHRD domain
MIRRALLAVSLTAVVAISGAGVVSADAPARHFMARLTGDQEVPPTGSPGTGTFDLRLTDNDTKLRFRLRAEGVTRIIQSHIHIGAPGTVGPVVVFFFASTPNTADKAITGDGFEVAGVRTASDFALPSGVTFAAFLADLRAGNTYVNIHSPAHPGGEIRGQIVPTGDDGGD